MHSRDPTYPMIPHMLSPTASAAAAGGQGPFGPLLSLSKRERARRRPPSGSAELSFHERGDASTQLLCIFRIFRLGEDAHERLRAGRRERARDHDRRAPAFSAVDLVENDLRELATRRPRMFRFACGKRGITGAASLERPAASARQSRSAAARPSPVTWPPSQMTWPDCSPPRSPPSRAQRLEHVAVADRSRDDPDPVLGHEPVEAEVRHHRDRDDVDAEREREDREDLVAVDRLAALVDREHAVAVAVERDPEVEPVARQRPVAGRARSVAPQPTLMFEPSGSTPIACTSAPSRSNAPGASSEKAPFAQSTPIRRPARSEPNALEDVRDVRARARPSTRSTDPPPGGARRAAPRSPPPARRRACAPSRSKSLTPLYSGGLCEAEMTTPSPSARSATAGVGSTPPRTAVPPADDDAARERLLELRPGAARVAPDEDAAAAGPERRRLADPLDEVGRQVVADDTADTIGSEDTRRGTSPRDATASRTAAPCAPCAGRPSCARRCERRA